MTIRKGLLNVMVTGTDIGTISMPVAAAASVPVSSTFITALWIACEETDMSRRYKTSHLDKNLS